MCALCVYNLIGYLLVWLKCKFIYKYKINNILLFIRSCNSDYDRCIYGDNNPIDTQCYKRIYGVFSICILLIKKL